MAEPGGRWTQRLIWAFLGLWLLFVAAVGAYPVIAILRTSQELAAWSAVGEILQGVGAISLALGTVATGLWAIHVYFRQRSLELELRARQSVIDVVHLVGEQIRALTLLAEQATSGEKQVYVQDLQETTRVYKALLDGLVSSREELQNSQRQALIASLAMLTRAKNGAR
jgi:hypothetical protein